MRAIETSRVKPTNSKKYTTLTVSKLRKYTGLQNLSKSEAMQAIDAIEKLSNLLFYMFKNSEIFDYENESID